MDASELVRLGLLHAAGCLAILGSQAATLAAWVGIGMLVRARFRPGVPELRDLVRAGWLGWALWLPVLVLWNFAWPVGGAAWLLLLAGGALALWRVRGDLRRALRGTPIGFLLAVLAVGYWEANLSLASNSAWDSGLYHVQGVMWASAYPVVPGLANLHGPLGFDNVGFLLFAMLDSGPWDGLGNHLGNGLAVLWLAIHALTGCLAWARSRARPAPGAVFDALLLAPALYLGLGDRVSSYITDEAMSAFVLAAGSELFRVLASRAAPKGERALGVVTSFALLSGATMLKSSAGAFAAAAGVLLLADAWRHRSAGREAFAPVLLGGGLAVALALVWMARTVVLSGYPLYPSTLLGFPVDWRVPEIHAQAEYAYAFFTERQFAWSLGPRWLAHFLDRPFDAQLPLVLALVLATLWLGLRRGRPDGRSAWPLALAAPVVVALGAWIATVPAFRYALGLFWTLLATVGALVLSSPVWYGRRLQAWLLPAALLLGVLPPLVDPLWAAGDDRAPLVQIARANLVAPEPHHVFHPLAGRPHLTDFVTDSGLVLHVSSGHCWDAPLPCTPNPAPGLELRRPGDLGSGFRVKGPWHMLNWPYRWRKGFLEDWLARTGRQP